eukprot:15472490-Alexandrium_andersonii.AAC.1
MPRAPNPLLLAKVWKAGFVWRSSNVEPAETNLQTLSLSQSSMATLPFELRSNSVLSPAKMVGKTPVL